MKKIIQIIFVFIFFLLFTKSSFAAGDFSTDYNVTYTIQSTADTKVSINVVMTNLSDNFYAASYDIAVGFTDIRNIKAADNGGSITPNVTKTDRGSKIDMPFNEQVLGLGKKLNFNITFDTKEVAQNLNNVWDVNIPGISNENDFSTFSVTVNYPISLGKPTFLKPNLPNAFNNASNHTIKFTKEELGSSGISMAFGDFQNYDFNLTYHLENKNVFATRTEIALPPTTNYQDIYINDIIPKPENVYADNDGNWLAQYTLSPSKRLNIKVLGRAKIYLSPKKELLNKENKEIYLKQQDFWETQNLEIQKLAKELKTPSEIYQYVVKNLNYDFSRVESGKGRAGASQTLKNPTSAVCLEFTDLFIAIARAAGIPTRAVNGFAYTDNSASRPLSLLKDVLHAWPEYYDFDQEKWIMIDPTWENTTNGVDYFNTLDFDHFAFVINGTSSTYPVPAGGYKLANNLNAKDVDVSITKSFTPKGAILEPTVNLSSNLIAGLSINGMVKIQNNGDGISKNSNLLIYTDKLTPNSQSYTVLEIPPYGYVLKPFYFEKTNILTKETDTVRIAIDETTIYKNIAISPFFFNKWIALGGILFVSIIFIVSFAYIGYRRLSILRQRRADNLRGEGDQPQKESL